MSSSSKHKIGRMRLGPRLLDADRLDLARRLAQSGRIGHPDPHAIEIQHHLEQIARRAGFVGDDRRLAPGQRVEQAGLAGIRRPEDDDLETIADDLGGMEAIDMAARSRRPSPCTSDQTVSETEPGTSSSSAKSISASIIARAWISRRRQPR